MASKTSLHVIKLIEKAAEEKASFLDLGNCGLTAVPEEIIICAEFLKEINFGSIYLSDNKNVNSHNKFGENNFATNEKSIDLLQKIHQLSILHFFSCSIGETGAEHISKLQALTSLNLYSNSIKEKGAEHISKLQKLTSLYLSFNFISDKGTEHISKIHTLTSLDLCSNSIREKGAEHISKLQKLTSLDLSSNSIREKGAEYISKLKELSTLYLSSNSIGEKGARHISQLQTLTTLNLFSNSIGEMGAEHISKLIALTSLVLASNSIGEKGIEHISKLRAITSLYLHNNFIGEKGTEHISKLQKLTSLDLSYNSIGDKGAEHISKLQMLTFLNLIHSSITEKGAEHLSKLKTLTTLYLSSNFILDKGAEHISKINALISLDLSNNNIGDEGAEHISKLKTLTSLDASSNLIGDKGAEHISKLKTLTSLYLSRNTIRDMGAEHISKLKTLTFLDLSENYIGDDGINKLIGSLQKLSNFDGTFNKTLTISPALLDQLEPLKAMLLSTEMVENNRVKMILIGNTKAGKTTLAQWLSEKIYNENKTSTHGIQHWIWSIDTLQKDFKVNIWDFGGQDYYHATHELFLNNETLFLLLKSSDVTKEEDEQQLSNGYWLEYVATSCEADKTPLWYLQTKADISPKTNKWLSHDDFSVYDVEAQYQIAVKEVNKKTQPYQNDFDFFESKLEQRLKQLATTKIPASWAKIRDEYLPKWRKNELYLEENDFKNKCEEVLKEETSLLNDLTATWDGIIPYLSKCGELVVFPDDYHLKNKIFLGAKELTDALYSLLSKEVEEVMQGRFNVQHIEKVDNGELLKEVLLAYQLIFKDPKNEDFFIAPQFLPIDPHVKHFSKLIPLSFAIRFHNYMSRSIITRFITKYAKEDKESFYWRYGAFFKVRDVHCFVRIDAQKQIVFVHVEDKSGKYNVMKELFEFFHFPEYREKEKNLLNIHSIIDKDKELALHIEKRKISISLDGKSFALISEVKKEIKNKAYRITCDDGNYMEINVTMHQLFNLFAGQPKRIFFSYSKKDAVYRSELEDHFAALKRSGKIDAWSDVDLLGGEEWDKKIKEELERADIVMLLLSPNFMATDYIWNTEIPKIIKEGKTVVPIFLRPCDWHEEIYEIDKYTALPAKGDWIVQNSKPNRDEGYLAVVEGIKKLL